MARLTSVRIRVRLFAVQREIAGTREIGLDLPDGATVADAWDGLVVLHPRLAPGRASVRFARNGAYAEPTTALDDGDEVAMIPPVSGGDGGGAAADHGARILEIRPDPFGAAIIAELADRLATDGDGAVVAFLGRTRATP
ncbi:MAG TPA: MoaD/ThiS family protein, partial [Candidatus Limnocylindrales bacterium]|nr:MoaD/ThiS family protein [Candidatus Limnocylindrales bacterium]